MSVHENRYWAVIPAAGVGRRMGSAIPKQYLPLHGKSVIEHTLKRFIDHPQISGVVAVLSTDDSHWSGLGIADEKLILARGGEERCHTVLNGLRRLQGVAADTDWVLVHDAARPCLRSSDIDHLIASLEQHPQGGLLGLPVADTVKRTDSSGEVEATVPRDNLWRALTPQMFRLGRLRDALNKALNDGVLVTDEASAIEYIGDRPLMVEGHGDNIKITRPADLSLAELFLSQQE